MNTFISDISQSEFPVTEKIPGTAIRHSLLAFIQKQYPAFGEESFMTLNELNYFREKYIEDFVRKETGDLSELENEVLNSMNKQSLLTDKLEIEDRSRLTTGQRIADKVATFGGSWTFISSFLFFLVVWICLNGFWLVNRAFDPFPFILLNLILSCIAAIQAPVIMMSQNRQEEKDRERGKNDYMINLKSELEVRLLHEKIDHFMLHQHQELMEVQQMQIEIMEDILKRISKE